MISDSDIEDMLPCIGQLEAQGNAEKRRKRKY